MSSVSLYQLVEEKRERSSLFRGNGERVHAGVLPEGQNRGAYNHCNFGQGAIFVQADRDVSSDFINPSFRPSNFNRSPVQCSTEAKSWEAKAGKTSPLIFL